MTGSTAERSGFELVGSDKVAAVLLYLEKEAAQRILKHFDDRELRRIARSAAALASVPPEMLEDITRELLEKLEGSPDVSGGFRRAEDLITGVAPPEQITEIMSDIAGTSNEMFWGKLANLNESVLASYLGNEHPQLVAVVALRLEPQASARVLARLSPDLRNDAMRRMLLTRPVTDAALRLIEGVLQEDLVISAAPVATNVRVAAIVNQMDRAQIEQILQSLTLSDPPMAEELKAMLFNFEDLPRLSARARALLVDQVPTDRLIMALRGADAVIREAVLPALSARMRRMVETELSSGESPPRKEIAAAQRAIAEAVLKLAETGAIELNPADAEEAGELSP